MHRPDLPTEHAAQLRRGVSGLSLRARQPLLGEVGHGLEHRVEVTEGSPLRLARAHAQRCEDSLLQLGNTLALPQLVGEGDEEVFEGEGLPLPLPVRDAEASDAGESLRFEERTTSLFVKGTWAAHLGRVVNLTDVVQRRAEQDLVGVKAGCVLRESRGELRRRFGDQRMVAEQVRGRTQSSEQGEGVIKGPKQDRDKSRPGALGCLSARAPLPA